MPGVAFEAESLRLFRGGDDALELSRPFRPLGGIAIAAGMKLDDIGAERPRRLELFQIGIYEK